MFLFYANCSSERLFLQHLHLLFSLGICIFLNLILFAVNAEANELSVQLASKTSSPPSRPYKLSNSYGYSYWIMLLIVLSNAATVIIIVFYQKARYSKRKEQERPMESAPKDGILF